MKQLFLIPVLVLLLASILTAQEDAEKRADALYFEGFGNNLYYGLFYDTRFNKSPKGYSGAIISLQKNDYPLTFIVMKNIFLYIFY